MSLKGFDARRFLDESWQQTPVYLQKALELPEGLPSPDELAGLALEEDVESRIVSEADSGWQLERGPFTTEDFHHRPNPWTLLVQSVNELIPDVSALLQHFDFLPSWRLDDIMFSYAVKDGGVGPHFDYYDVFLVQVSGQREWKIGQRCDHNSALRQGTELSILEDFETSQQHICSPGDVLYVPSGIAHWGKALDDDCVTCSVGFRAPSLKEVLSELSLFIADKAPASVFYTDPGDLSSRQSQSEISSLDLQQLRHLLEYIHQQEDQSLAAWFGCYMTETKNPDSQILEQPQQNFEALLQGNSVIYRDETVRMAWFRKPGETADGCFFINGEVFHYPRKLQSLVEYLADHPVIPMDTLKTLLLTQTHFTFFNQLFYHGFWYVDS